MSYDIKEILLTNFVSEESNYMLPRYQRQERWKPEDNFGLAISIFQDYPIGVLIIDERDGKSWLLDGRQRQNALKKMVNDPTELYWWARDYIGFNEKTKDNKVVEKFWAEIDRFIKKENKDNTENKKNKKAQDDGMEDDPQDDPEDDQGYGDTDEALVMDEIRLLDATQRKRLEVLLHLILMVHKLKPTDKTQRWEELFDFRYEGGEVMNSKYYIDNVVDFPQLRTFLIGYTNSLKDNKLPTEDDFRDYCERSLSLKGNDRLRKLIRNNWELMNYSIGAIKDSYAIFSKISIGTIVLENIAFLDALNIFTRINSKGVQLEVEELLSANPFWNEPIPIKKVAYEVETDIRTMYENLGLERFEKFVRWDIVATLIDRLGDKLVLKQTGKEEGKFVGFKLLSSIYANGMSKQRIAYLQEKKEIVEKLEKEVFATTAEKSNTRKRKEILVDKLKSLLKILEKDEFFATLIKGRKTIAELLGDAPALEFITVLFNSWEKKGRPGYTKDSQVVMDIQEEARKLFDTLTFEKLDNQWRGSGDSKMANHIINWEARLKEPPIDYSAWEEKILSACEAKKTEQSPSAKNLVPILYYFEALRGDKGFWSEDTSSGKPYHVDHIIPRKRLRNRHFNKAGYNANCLANLELLSETKNEEKKDLLLNELDDGLAQVVSRAAGGLKNLDLKDIKEKYSDPDPDNPMKGFENLVKDRKAIFLELLRTKRQKLVGLPKVEENSEPKSGTNA